jgi:hypothetical protein
VEFRWFKTTATPKGRKAGRTYCNPVVLALQWRQAIDAGWYSSQADLARRKGVSRARVTQILNLLRLAPEVIGIVMDLGDPLPAPMVTERQLRRIINLPRRKQLKELTIIPGGMRSSAELTRRS